MSSQEVAVGKAFAGSGLHSEIDTGTEGTQPEVLMATNSTKLRKVAKKATRLATAAGKKASSMANDAGASAAVLTHSAAKAVTAMVKKQQRKRKVAKMKSVAKKVGVGLAAAAAVTGAAMAVRQSRKPKSRFR